MNKQTIINTPCFTKHENAIGINASEHKIAVKNNKRLLGKIEKSVRYKLYGFDRSGLDIYKEIEAPSKLSLIISIIIGLAIIFLLLLTN